MDKLRFATVFAFMENIHIIKDPGMIPITMSSEYGYSVAVPLSSLYEYPNADIYFSDIEAPTVHDRKASMRCINRYRWIKRNAEYIDVLNLFFFDRWTFLDILTYLRRNNRGLVYVHADSDGTRLREFRLLKNHLSRYLLKKTVFTDRNLNKILWGVQNRAAANELGATWPFRNIEYVPDGIYWNDTENTAFEDRENIILTVARNGTAPKRTDILLEGWAAVAEDFPGWKLRLVGTVEDDFNVYLDNYFNEHPNLRNRVDFVGAISDRSVLASEYSRAKIFALTSDWESFGIVTAEAMSKGCYVIGSDIPATSELLEYGKYGTLFKAGDKADFTEKLRNILNDEYRLSSKSQEISDYANSTYSWANVLAPVNKWIKDKYYGYK